MGGVGAFKQFLINFILYLIIKSFCIDFCDIYGFVCSIYRLALTKSRIPDVEMTGITSVAYGYVPLLNNITISTNFNLEDNYFSPITFQPDLSILIPLILIFSVLLFSLLLYCNYKFYCQRVKKIKISEKTGK